MNKISCVYKCLAPDGKIYIGATIDFKRRMAQYRIKTGLSFQKLLRESVQKFGIESHLFEIIEECPISSLPEIEMYWVNKYRSNIRGIGLNMTNGGKGTRGFRVSEANKTKISEANSKQVFMYSISGDFIRSFYSEKEAAEKTEANYSNIAQVCRGFLSSSGGYIWSYKKFNNIFNDSNVTPLARKREVIAKDSFDNIVGVYQTITEASLHLNITNSNISRCLSGIRTSAGGLRFIWGKETDRIIGDCRGRNVTRIS